MTANPLRSLPPQLPSASASAAAGAGYDAARERYGARGVFMDVHDKVRWREAG